jgi:hypothetical protein
MVVTHTDGTAKARLEITFERFGWCGHPFSFLGEGLHAKEGHMYDMPAAMRAFQAHDL